MSNGLVTQIIGAVIDVEFEKNNIPQVYEAIKITDTGTVLEVQQQLGDALGKEGPIDCSLLPELILGVTSWVAIFPLTCASLQTKAIPTIIGCSRTAVRLAMVFGRVLTSILAG